MTAFTVELNPNIAITARNERTVYVNSNPNRHPQAKAGRMVVNYTDLYGKPRAIQCSNRRQLAEAHSFIKQLANEGGTMAKVMKAKHQYKYQLEDALLAIPGMTPKMVKLITSK
jgi:hypothetical protein